MGHNAYPVADDVKTFLQSDGRITVSSGLLTQLDAAVKSAIRDFEKGADRVPLLAGAASVRQFNPPTNRDGVLSLGRDLAAPPTAVVYQPAGGSPQPLTQTTAGAYGDFTLEPFDAPADECPYDRLVFGVRRWTEPLLPAERGALYITGQWGYATELPDDAWLAMILAAAAVGIVTVASGTGGFERRKIEDFEVQYPRNGPYAQQVREWSRTALAIRQRYERADL